jgi:hypothetical protein
VLRCLRLGIVKQGCASVIMLRNAVLYTIDSGIRSLAMKFTSLFVSRSWPDSLVPHFLLTGLTNADIVDCPGLSGIVGVGCGLIRSLWILGCFLCKIK